MPGGGSEEMFRQRLKCSVKKMFRENITPLEHFQKSYSRLVLGKREGGLFGFWLRFGSVTGLFKPAPSPKPRQNPKILAPNGYNSFSNALKSEEPKKVCSQSFGAAIFIDQIAGNTRARPTIWTWPQPRTAVLRILKIFQKSNIFEKSGSFSNG
jgi:hypothetical protein